MGEADSHNSVCYFSCIDLYSIHTHTLALGLFPCGTIKGYCVQLMAYTLVCLVGFLYPLIFFFLLYSTHFFISPHRPTFDAGNRGLRLLVCTIGIYKRSAQRQSIRSRVCFSKPQIPSVLYSLLLIPPPPAFSAVLSPSPTQIHNLTLELASAFYNKRDIAFSGCGFYPFSYRRRRQQGGLYTQCLSFFDGPSGFKMMTGCCTSSRKKSLTVSAALYSLLPAVVCMCIYRQFTVGYSIYIGKSIYQQSSHKGEVNRGEPNVRFFLFFFSEFQVVCLTDGRNIVIPLAIYFLSGHGSHPAGEKKKWMTKIQKEMGKTYFSIVNPGGLNSNSPRK